MAISDRPMQRAGHRSQELTQNNHCVHSDGRCRLDLRFGDTFASRADRSPVVVRLLGGFGGRSMNFCDEWEQRLNEM